MGRRSGVAPNAWLAGELVKAQNQAGVIRIQHTADIAKR